MPSIYDLKPKFQQLLRPIVAAFAHSGVTANQVTLFAAGLSIAVGLALYFFSDQHWILLLVPITLFMRMALNAIDGMLAREHNMQSNLGAVLNELGDVVSDVALYLPFAIISGLNPALVVLIIAVAIISEMAGVVAVQIGASRRYEGPMGKSDRAFVFGILAVLLFLNLIPELWSDIYLGIVLLLLVITVINRVKAALKETG